MLGEPGRTNGDINVRLFGIPIRIHPLFWLIAVLLGTNSPGLREILIWVAAVFISILIHELGHALVIKAYGFRPWIVLFGMGGLTIHDPAENYRSKANTTLGQISISFAGPLAGFLLAAALVAVLFLAGHRENVQFVWHLHLMPFWVEFSSLARLVNDIFFISVLWGLVNLLPIYPLDGGQITREILHYLNPSDGIRQSLILSLIIAVLFAAFGLIQWNSIYICLLL